MSLRRLYHEQPDSFAFTPANLEWAKCQIAKYPEGRQASAVIPLLWRGQEQEGWVSRPMIEEVARLLGMPQIRVLEVATFYFMFQLRPVGSVAHVQVCGTTSCMICGAEDLIGVCKERISKAPYQVSADGRFSWEEVECLGACANAPMVQIGKDYYEDLTAEKFATILDELAAGRVPAPGPQNGRFASEPLGGLTSLTDPAPAERQNASMELADALGDTVARIDGSGAAASAAAVTSRGANGRAAAHKVADGERPAAQPAQPPENAPETASLDAQGERQKAAELHAEETVARPPVEIETEPTDEDKPELLTEARAGAPDDLKRIKGVGPKLEGLLHSLGVFHFDQVASWSDKEVAWVDYHLEGFKGRIRRDDWVAQAKVLTLASRVEGSDAASGSETNE